MAVTFDAVGSGVVSAGTGNASATGTHSGTAGADVLVYVISTGNNSFPITGVTYGGTSMTLLQTEGVNGNTANGQLSVWHLANIPSGTQNVVVTDAGGSSFLSVVGISISYLNVGSVGSITTAHNTGTSLSQSVTGATGRVVVQGFGITTSSTFSSITGGNPGATRYNNETTGAAANCSLLVQDSTASGSITFSATASTSGNWAGIGVVLLPPVTGALPGQGVLSATTEQIFASNPAQTGRGVLSGTATATKFTVTASLAGHGVITATRSVQGVVSGHGALTAACKPIIKVAVPIAGTGALTGSAPPALKPHLTGHGALTASASNGFTDVIALLAAGQSTAIQTIGDSTANGFGDASNLFGWQGRFGIAIGQFYNVNVTIQSFSGSSWTGTSVLYSSTNGGSAPTLNLLNSGVDGTKLSGDVTELSSNLLEFTSTASAMFIATGFNDVSAVDGTGSFPSNMATFIGDIQATYPHLPIIITTENQITSYTNNSDALMAAAMSAMSTLFTGNNLPLTPPLQASTNTPNVWILDTRQAFDGWNVSSLMYSTPHPNAQGYGIQATWMIDELTQAPALPIAISGHGVLSAVTKQICKSSATPTGHGTLSAVAFSGGILTAALHGTGTLTETAFPQYKRSPIPTGHGNLSATAGIGGAHISVALTGNGHLAVAAHNALLQELTYFTAIGYYYNLQSPNPVGDTNAEQFIGDTAQVTFTPRLPAGFTILVNDLDLRNGNFGPTAVVVAPITAQIVNTGSVWQLCAINANNSPGIKLLANTTSISNYLTTRNIESGQLIYDVSFSHVSFAGDTQIISNFAFAAPTTNTTTYISDPGLTTIPYQNP